MKEAVNKDNDNEHKHYNLGKAFLGNGKISEALEEFRQANTIRPHLDYFQDKLAYTCLLAGNTDEAEKIYQDIPLHKRKSYIWCNYGRVLLQMGKCDEAIKAFCNAERQDYQNHHIHFHLGLAYLETGNIAFAVKELELAAGLKLKRFGSEYKEAIEKLEEIHSQFGEDMVVVGSDSGNQNHVGRIESYNANRGFGFLKSESGEKVFFHISDVLNPENISPGLQAEFSMVESDKGPKAIGMTVVQ